MKSWLDFIWDIYVNGVQKTRPKRVNYVGSITATETNNGEDLELTFAGSSSGAPTTANYVVTQSDPALTDAHVLSSTPSIQWSWSSGEISADCNFGTTSGSCCEGNDSRLSNDRAASGIRTATTLVSCSSAAAPSAGQSLVATSSTAATWQTVCLSSDARLPTTPAELTTGQKLIVSGSSVKTSGRLGAWWNCGVVPTANANSTSSVTVLGLDVRPGDPVRILDKTGFFYGAGTPRINQLALTGLKGSLADYRGRLHYKAVSVSAGVARIDVYDSESCTNRIGYTANFSTATTATLTLAYTSTGTQGVTGNVYVYNTNESITLDAVQSIGLFATGICTAYNRATGLLTFAGQAVSNTPGCILEVWLGSPTLVVNWPIDLGGAYAGANVADAFITRRFKKEFWDLPNGTLVQVKCSNMTNDTGATQAKIAAVVAGSQVVADGSALALSTSRVSTVVEMTPTLQPISYGDQLGLRVLKGTNGNSSDLEGHFVVVLD